MPSPFSKRVLRQVELALLSDCDCAITLGEIRNEASAAGLTGVEIEAALAQRSFDVRTSALVALACAIKSAQGTMLETARQRAAALAWSADEIAAFERIAESMIRSRAQQDHRDKMTRRRAPRSRSDTNEG